MLSKVVKKLNKILNFKKEERRIRFFPGIYNFYMPYLGYWSDKNKYNQKRVYMCEVEMLVGEDEDLKDNILATIIIRVPSGKGIGITNYFENIATNIRLTFFREIFPNIDPYKKNMIDDSSIRWIEQYLYEEKSYRRSTKLVDLTWNQEKKRYENPKWGNYDADLYKFKYVDSIEPGDIFVGFLTDENGLFLCPQNREVVVIKADTNYSEIVVAPIEFKSKYKRNTGDIILDDKALFGEESIIKLEKKRILERNNLRKKLGRVDEETMFKIREAWEKNLEKDKMIHFQPIESKIKLNQRLNIEENKKNEFKEINSGNPKKTINNKVEKYMVGFLNNQGGRIFYGINDYRKVVGIKISYDGRDELRQIICNRFCSIKPSPDISLLKLIFHDVYNENNRKIDGLYVLEIRIDPPHDPFRTHLTRNGSLYVKMNGILKKLKDKDKKVYQERRN